jgi:hypothetical protein
MNESFEAVKAVTMKITVAWDAKVVASKFTDISQKLAASVFRRLFNGGEEDNTFLRDLSNDIQDCRLSHVRRQ